MKKFVCAVVAFIFALATPCTSVASPAACTNWYIRHTGNHERPICDSRFSFIENYDAAYIGAPPKADGDKKIIYLTFDAGYENGNIEKILNTLQAENVPAAFFILQNIVYKNAALLKRMTEEGHLVCNHTAHHRDMSRADEAAFCEELREMETVYREKTGTELAKFYRPPEGKFTEENLKWAQEMGYTTVLWSFAYADWDNEKQPDPGRAKEKILSNTHPGEILLLHPTSATNAAILSDLIHAWREEGYVFGTLSDLKK